MSELLDAAQSIAGTIVADRRAIHAHPELAYQEKETAALVEARLRDLGIEHRGGVGGTGVIGLVRGARPGRTVLLRGDMDALPITEESDAPYVSQNPGVMHACGHDAHTAMLLGAARILQERRAHFDGAVKLMFQPAEEGGAGAVKMIAEGLLDDPTVDAAFAIHTGHDFQTGTMVARGGPLLAGANSFTITVTGRGGHASRPHTTVDPVVVASQIVVALQTLVSREVQPGVPAVITIGALQAGTTFNVIPDRARIMGTIRAYDAGLMEQLEARIETVARGVASALRAEAKVEIQMHYPPTINNDAMVELAGGALQRLGISVVQGSPIMAAEDFSFVLQRVPGAMLMLGVKNPSWTDPKPAHTAQFDLDEAALPLGTAAYAAMALEFLQS
ncbi:MAG TPA: M20 family metallopeptidase [Candidatus Dormibacteraeota bacterium]|jgi:amidohydrolase